MTSRAEFCCNETENNEIHCNLSQKCKLQNQDIGTLMDRRHDDCKVRNVILLLLLADVLLNQLNF